jgi:protein O-mannosyl-transferase
MGAAKRRAKRRKASNSNPDNSSNGRAGIDRRLRLLFALGPALLAFLLYFNALNNPFVYDDHHTVIDNASLVDPSQIKGVLLHMRFRPLVNLSYAVDYSIWQLNPFGYHLTNLILHLVNIPLCYLLFLAFIGDARRKGLLPAPSKPEENDFSSAAFLSLIFAIHPMLTEAVGYVSARSELLCGCFFLVSFLLFRRGIVESKRRWFLPATVAWLFSLATKEVGAMLPLLLLLYDRLLLTESKGGNRRLWNLHFPLLSIVAAGGCLRLYSYIWVEASGAGSMLWQNLQTQFGVVWRYMAMLLVPVGQSITHHISESDQTFRFWPLIAGVLLLGVVLLALKMRRRYGMHAFGFLGFLIILLPTSLIPLAEPMAEHRVYLASILFFLGVWACILSVGHRLEIRLGKSLRPLAIAISVAVVVALSAATCLRNDVWDDPISLWRDAAATSPKSPAAHFALGDAHRLGGNCPDAVTAYQRAVVLLPRQADALNNLGICLAKTKRLPESIKVFKSVLAFDKKNIKALNNLGMARFIQGRLQQAAGYYRRSLRLEPKNPVAGRQLRDIERRLAAP